jgi:hypothetical protein
VITSEEVTGTDELPTLLDVAGVYVDQVPVDFPSPLFQAVNVNKSCDET